MKRVWPRLPLLLAALAPSLTPTSADSSPTTVPVYVPGYQSENWDDLAGSVITSDSTATTYTIFCPDTDDCQIAGRMQFTFAEGPSTFKYSGEVEDMLTAVISCQLVSTTAATCTEYSSFGAGWKKGNTTGPTEVSRTETYLGSEVQWGVLTLTTPAPTGTADQAIGGSGMSINPSDTAWFFPKATRTSRAARSVEPPSRPVALAGAVVVGTTVIAMGVLGV
ncbi:hypothetical protein M406DRAFT_327945 [Cryphonectria parasitica EP155]|uniref:Uncharacterized protein n=1 Tax=Cryphonectria parasitica (strain ATCC 38755 / EP155) TaxID=660469 RepID=A0A9P4Y5H3_CRYP1|nr:uncharacterized protein M406DRAFT_327945 [Cryphonectria parasitica EP155]KAF3766829.1 hypothetical protein M406DRAFT_327945 [Cryphonectria parasitica EP155]